MIDISNTIDEFRQAITAAGLEAPDHIEPGRVIKFPGHQKSGSNKAAWCFLFDDLRGGVFGDYSTNLESTWQANNSAPYTATERQSHSAKVKAMQAQREADLLATHQQVSEIALQRFNDAKPCTEHPYLKAKGVQGHGVRVEADGFLIVPMRDTAGKLWNIERINPADFKDNYEAAVQRELGADYPKLEGDGRRVPLALWYPFRFGPDRGGHPKGNVQTQ